LKHYQKPPSNERFSYAHLKEVRRMEYEVIYNGADEEGIEVKNMLQDFLNIVSESGESLFKE